MSALTPEMEARFNGLRRIIGNTPLLAVTYSFRGRTRRVFAKSENLNMTGSIKDRVALHALYQAHGTRAVHPGAPLVDAVGGNAAISLAAVGRALGHPVHLFVPEGLSAERRNLLRAFGARLHPVSREEEADMSAADRARAWAGETTDAFVPSDLAHRDNLAAHEATTGPEIHWQLGSHGLTPDAFVAGVGTGGTVSGAGRYLKEHHPEVRIHPLVASATAAHEGGAEAGAHRVEGVASGAAAVVAGADGLADTVSVEDGDAILMAQRLAAQIGLGVGISAGANFLGAVLLHERMGDDAVVVTVLCDSNKKYLSTDLLRDEPERDGYHAPSVELRDFTAYNRTCQMCDQVGDLLRLAGG